MTITTTGKELDIGLNGVTTSGLTADPARARAVDSLHDALVAQRQYTLAIYDDLPAAYWRPADFPYAPAVNPPLWELAHIAWFAEFFCLRWRPDDVDGRATGSLLAGSDALFNSSVVSHRDRWTLAYPQKDACLAFMQAERDALLEALAGSRPDRRYGFQLAIAHEDMHAEALLMTRRTLGLALPAFVSPESRRATVAHTHDIVFAGGTQPMGSHDGVFRFDNENPAFEVTVAPFSISGGVVSAEAFSAFSTSAAYCDARHWSAAGNAWRLTTPSLFSIDREQQVAMHVNFHEAEAWCHWAGRRLPTEPEWEFAATHSAEFYRSTGQIWEWTASPFAPYPGFRPDRYRDYSEPWFHTHQVLKGGSFATNPRLKYPQYRNFFRPDRGDVFCGFRSCALT